MTGLLRTPSAIAFGLGRGRATEDGKGSEMRRLLKGQNVDESSSMAEEGVLSDVNTQFERGE